MRRRALAVVAVTFFMLTALLPVGVFAKSSTTPASSSTSSARPAFQRATLQDGQKIDTKVLTAMRDPNKQVMVIVQLKGDPVAVREASAGRTFSTAEKTSVRNALKAPQAALASRIKSLGGRIVGTMQDAYNGIQLSIKASQVSKLAALPGVVKVHAVTTYTRDNVNAIPYTQVPAAWDDTGIHGGNQTIAVIDTGIDYYHANFGGSGDPADFVYGEAHDTTVPAHDADGTTVAFPNTKVIGGFDFSGDAYNADDPLNDIPAPDPNPLDCGIASGGDGHGSHTAGTAAGLGVLSNGTTFEGPWNSSTYADNTFLIGPGVAPLAQILSYRVFGCVGSSNLITLAINQAVADGATVISMSLGSDFAATPLADDPDVIASDNASGAGIVVVAASGNAGPGAYITGVPGASNRVISVAAIDGTTATIPGVHIALTSDSVDGALNNNQSAAGIVGTLDVLSDGAGGIGLGCNASDYAGVSPGDIVVTMRNTCDRVTRAELGQAAGAAAVILVNNGPGLPPFEGNIVGPPPGNVPVTIPFIGVTPDDGATLLADNGQTATLSTTSIDNPTYQQVASFSSAGWRNGDSGFKPDVSAPGVSVVSTGVGTGTQGETLSGTSMATPNVAGIAALVLQAHPEWTNVATRADFAKAAIMNNADDSNDAHGVTPYDPRLAGAGVANADAAGITQVMATTADHTDALSYGYQPLADGWSATKSFTVTNETASTQTFDLSSAFAEPALGTTIDINDGAETVDVPAHGTAQVDVTLTLDPAAVAALPAAEEGTLGAVVSTAGNIVLTPEDAGAGVGTIHVPFNLVPRGISDVTASARSAYAAAGTTSTASTLLTNGGIHQGNGDVYAWGLTDPQDLPGDTVDIRDVGVQVLPGAALGSDTSDRGLVFAINTWGQASTEATNFYDVAIDTNGDGTADFDLQAADLGLLTTGLYNGTLAAVLFDSDGNQVGPIFFADAPSNGSTVELPVLASSLGLSIGHGKFSYQALAENLNTGGTDIANGTAWFDAYAPAVSTGDFIPLDPGTSGNLPLSVDNNLIKQTPAMGWMVVTMDDANGASQADVVPIGKVATRLSGATRYDTAAAISAATFRPGVDAAFVVSGLDFPDGLGAGPAAAAMGGPVLLVPPSGPIPASVTAELTRLDPGKIYVVGGTSSVSAATATTLGAIAPVQRLAGADRYETAAKVATTIFDTVLDDTPLPVVYIASGANFPDALAAGPAASHFHGALLLAPATGALPTSVKNALTTLAPATIVIVGGTSSISAAMASQIQTAAGLTSNKVSRVAGSDRYATAAALAASFGSGTPTAYVALGSNFPDAMAGSAAAGFTGGPILLVQTDSVPAATSTELAALAPDDLFVLGGVSVISDTVVNAISPFIAPDVPEP